jgi:ClpP class serine protease
MKHASPEAGVCVPARGHATQHPALAGQALAWGGLYQARLVSRSALTLDDDMAAMRAPKVTIDGDTAVVEIKGALVHDAGFWDLLFGAVDLAALAETFDKLAADPRARRVAVKLNCPGGDVRGITRAAGALARLSAVKPTLAIVDGLAASGGYWLASQCREISAAPLSDVGSIGVIMGPICDDADFWAQMGVRWMYATTGQYKALGGIGQRVTEAQMDMLRGLLKPVMDAFVGAIVAGRKGKVVADAVIALDAAILKDSQALTAGLIDAIEEVPEALARFARGEAAPKASTAPDQSPDESNPTDGPTNDGPNSGATGAENSPPDDSPEPAPDAPDDDEDELGGGDSPMPDETKNSPAPVTAPVTAPKPATIAELRTLGASAEFVLAAAEAQMTLPQAQLSWTTAQAMAPKPTQASGQNSAQAGAALNPSVRGQEGLAGDVNASAYGTLVHEAMRASTDLDYAGACEQVAREQPEAHAAWLEAGCPAVSNPFPRRMRASQFTTRHGFAALKPAGAR